jgi:S-adenosylmethionine hydrolase
MRAADAPGPVITFLSDYGSSDEFVGVCHGVIARRCPGARIIDVTHGVPRGDVRSGAIMLGDAIPFLPTGVHLAIVDPRVGARGERARRAVALRAGEEGQLLVGPDNGLLSLAAARLGGVAEAVDVGDSPVRLEPVSHTFHGRDVFAPVAAALAAGRELAELGTPLAPQELCALALPSAEREGDRLTAHVLRVDGFGNLVLDASAEQLAELGLRRGDRLLVSAPRGELPARFASTFADVEEGALLLYEDAQRALALADTLGSATELLGAGRDDELRLSPA